MYVTKNYSSMIVTQGDTTPRIFPSVTLRKDFRSVTLVTEGFFFYTTHVTDGCTSNERGKNAKFT